MKEEEINEKPYSTGSSYFLEVASTPTAALLDKKDCMKIGDHVRKIKGFKFVGQILALYSFRGANYAVVVCDPDTAQDGLQHIYKVEQLEFVKPTNYERDHSHYHCPDTNSPCGMKGKHRCCLCEKTPDQP